MEDCVINMIAERVFYRDGLLIWKPRDAAHFVVQNEKNRQRACARWNAIYAGKQAFNSVTQDGYKSGCIEGKFYLAHRVVWALHYGKWPSGLIDHKNGIRDDNRIENLRDVDFRVNSRNRNDSKYAWPGVHINKGRWTATIRDNNGRQTNLGRFDTEMEAVNARKAAEAKYWGSDVRTR